MEVQVLEKKKPLFGEAALKSGTRGVLWGKT